MSEKTATQLEVDRGPNWLFVRVTPGSAKSTLGGLANDLRSVVSTHFTYRVVLEMEEFDRLSDEVVEQLDDLRHWLEEHHGALRVCGLRPECAKRFAAYCERSAEQASLLSHPSLASAVLGPEHACDGVPTQHYASHESATYTTPNTDRVAASRR